MSFSRSALQPLTEELSRAADQGLSLPFWWRDDDAVERVPRPALVESSFHDIVERQTTTL